jgi:hypothetical protein
VVTQTNGIETFVFSAAVLGAQMETGLHIENSIKALYPDIVRNRIQVHSSYNARQALWQVKFKKNKYVLVTILEKKDVDLLLSSRKCLSLSVGIQQVVDSLSILDSNHD